MNLNDNIRLSFLAGICIAIGGTVYLKVGGVAGAILFAFGLLAVVSLKLNLFTGKSQFIWGADFRGYGWLAIMLMANFAGCLALSLAVNTPELSEAAGKIIESRQSAGPLRCGILAIGCGFIMTTAVRGATNGNFWPLLFGVPAFIICGFPHCVADAFYLCCAPTEITFGRIGETFPYYLAAVAGNFIGCNLYRLALPAQSSPFSRMEEIKEAYSSSKK